MNIFIDTSGFIAVLDRDDAHHARSAQAWKEMLTTDETLITTNYVLVETFALAQNRLGIRASKVLQEDIVPVLQVEWVNNAVHHAAVGIMLSTARKKLSLVDCVSFKIMRLLGITTAFTLDKHFKEQGFICLPG
jgi:uncharacterized protein